MPGIIELPSFTLKEGVSKSEFLQVHQQFNQNFMQRQKGYLFHKLLRDGETWYDLAGWESMESVEAAFEDIYQNPAAAAYIALIDQIGGDDEIPLFKVVASY